MASYQWHKEKYANHSPICPYFSPFLHPYLPIRAGVGAGRVNVATMIYGREVNVSVSMGGLFIRMPMCHIHVVNQKRSYVESRVWATSPAATAVRTTPYRH